MKGNIIVIEGADGAGKATQTKLLVERLRADGVAVETIDFPQYKPNHFGQLLRECLDGNRGDFMQIDPKIASTLYAADRFESLPQIKSWLEAGKTVVADRYVSANMLHQGAKILDGDERQVFLEWLATMEYKIFGVPKPDKTIYLSVPAKERQLLISSDSIRQTADVAEQSSEHQLAADECAKDLIEMFGWTEINCFESGSLRTRESINDDVYKAVKG
ncbi:MAG: dTMP kinase [Candidatus Paceibacteria bacterium]|jgi:dTMP kinase